MSITDAHDRDRLNQILKNWRLTPATFAHKISNGRWIPKKHLQFISAKVASKIAQGNARIIISAPPRHGKSELTSVYTPAWLLENFPDKYVVMATYGAELSVGFGRRVRDFFEDDALSHLLKTRLKKDATRVNAFLTDQGGGMFSVGLGGALTGRGAHVLLIDDYIKEIKEALSQSYRDYIWDWFITTAFTRLEPGGSCIIIATRWHTDDLIGRLLKYQGDQWDYIELPAIAEENDMIGREVGEALFPERYALDRLYELRETLGTTYFNALYQQKPVDESQKLTNGDWLKVVDVLPRIINTNVKQARIWDLAATHGGGDYTVGTHELYYPDTGNLYISNVIRRQLSPGAVETLVRQTAVMDGYDTEVLIEQEPGASGKALIEHYQKTVLPEFKVNPVPAVNNKVVRAQPFIAGAEAGKVHLLKGPWNDVFIKEFDTFPGVFDDQVDTAGAGYSKLSGKRIYTATFGRDIPQSPGKSMNSKIIRAAQFQSSTGGRRATFGRG